ncbi:L-histidine N(alpha)-methyltransferase [Undibacterium terreum]|uniref:Dimethylhistidine N-methyltransferase n=1 Tax=Undibacterium terreum TaxID=1224302 RepID=A0A916UFU9_9BURK|nr:L-histidine N(alpha)-methyltransferase [Undibacterium terreum]GGC70475.1 dimethylhistidine N-methyltransferase [Undibacterium terreum]
MRDDLQTRFIQLYREDADELNTRLHIELSNSLLSPQASLSPKYFYDTLGSRLFQAICALPEYYPTRTEAAIFTQYRQQMAESIGTGSTMIDLGAGDCAKAASLFGALRPEQYVPVDISVDFVRGAVESLQHTYPQIDMLGVGMDFSARLDLPDEVRREKRLFFYPGSSIGNFTLREAIALLRRMRLSCDDDGGLLIGVDLVKDKNILEPAYDDALGLTAAFNLNILNNINRLLGSDFELKDWQHKAFYHPDKQRIEMYLEARRDLAVRWQGKQRDFVRGERIHTENSYKYTPESFIGALNEAGFARTRMWTDEQGWFAVFHATP